MTKKLFNHPCIEHCTHLRETYARASPSQRLKIARDRVRNPLMLSHKMASVLAAIEALSRSVCLTEAHTELKSVLREYERLRFEKPISLLRRAATLLKIEVDQKMLEDFKLAIEYRNLVVHEAITIRQGFAEYLLTAVNAIFKLLSDAVEKNTV